MSTPRLRLSAVQVAVLRSVRDRGRIPLTTREVTIQALRHMKLIGRVASRHVLAHLTIRGTEVLERYERRHAGALR